MNKLLKNSILDLNKEVVICTEQRPAKEPMGSTVNSQRRRANLRENRDLQWNPWRVAGPFKY